MTRPHLLQFTGEVKKTALTIRELHACEGEKLNEEWILLENSSGSSINVRGCTITVAENEHRRPSIVGTLDPGFILEAGAQIRLVSGSAANKKHGAPPKEDSELKNYHLFLKEKLLSTPGMVVRLDLRQLDLARAIFDPGAKGGIAVPKEGA